jgi:hypothetical protein
MAAGEDAMAAAAMDGGEVDDSVYTFGGRRRGAPKRARWRTVAGSAHTSAEEVCYGPANGDGTGRGSSSPAAMACRHAPGAHRNADKDKARWQSWL